MKYYFTGYKDMPSKKIPLNVNVLDAARDRIAWAFETFPSVCISFSGGKDSTVLLHLAAETARQKRKTFSILFIDWEVQFQYTIDHVRAMRALYHDVTRQFYWVALPLTTVSGVSQLQPEWIAWEKDTEWVRMPPDGAITDLDFFPFYHYAMTFEEFVPAFSTWLSGGEGLVTLTGVRADESLNRFSSLTSKTKLRYASDLPWTTVSRNGNYCTATPLYDWKVKDIWTYQARFNRPVNPLYDLMYRAGVPMKHMRVCEPFGPEQRQGLWLYHILEPETWSKVCSRVAGARTGAIYANQSGRFYAKNVQITRPVHLSWQEYAHFLLESMPARTAEHYRTKIAVYLKWYADRSVPVPDEQEKDTGTRDIPSWRRICRTLIKNDYWCRTLSFSPNKASNYSRYMERMTSKRKEWGIL